MVDSSKTKFIYSEITGKNFPILEKAADLVPEGAGVERVYVISPEELLDYEPELKEEMTKERAFSEGRMTISEHNEFIATYDHVMPKVFRGFLDERYPELSGLIHDSQLQGLSDDILQGAPVAVRYDTDITDSKNTLALIVTPYADMSKEVYATIVTGLPLESIENLPGSDEDWRTKILIHEIPHVPQDAFTANLRHEVMAGIHLDSVLSGKFNGIAVDSVIQDGAALSHADQGLNAIASFNGNTKQSHITNAAVQSGSEGFAPKGSIEDFKNGLVSAKELVHSILVASAPPSTEAYKNVVKDLMTDIEVFEGFGVGKDHDILKKMMDNSTTMLDMVDKLSPNVLGAFNYFISKIDEEVGKEIFLNNPAALYDATKNLYLEGKFDDNPIGKQYAYEYLEAAKAIAPTIHEASVEDAFVAPEFNEIGKFVEPVLNTAPKL